MEIQRWGRGRVEVGAAGGGGGGVGIYSMIRATMRSKHLIIRLMEVPNQVNRLTGSP